MIWRYLLMCLIYGTTFLGIKTGLNGGFEPFFYAGLRFGTAGILVLAFLAVKNKSFPAERRDYVDMAMIGIGMTGIEFAGFYWAEQYVTSGYAALLAAATPLLVTLMNYWINGQSITQIQKAGLALGFLGVFLIIFPQILEGGLAESNWFISSAVILVAEVFYAFGAVHSRKVLARGNNPFVVNGFQMFFGSLFLFILAILFEPVTLNISNPMLGYSSLLYLIVFGSIIASGIFYWLVQRTNPLFPSTWTYVSPVIAIIVGYILLNETLHAVSVIGAIVVLLGVLLTNAPSFRAASGSVERDPAA
ncbi:hypothetical protein SY83_20510 [Paenibacillus swuensis]|uniref:EamA domain-containing protein n=1 Tax=Paenibacillus swuensis TaxID=1178515 RepID=A0A172TN09_9BACL|nr:EamA family transporter [Paenibacillus swuensis]ANE48274.1 hypothetical protein SY83_20510 [Paenibacillus swuensis]